MTGKTLARHVLAIVVPRGRCWTHLEPLEPPYRYALVGKDLVLRRRRNHVRVTLARRAHRTDVGAVTGESRCVSPPPGEEGTRSESAEISAPGLRIQTIYSSPGIKKSDPLTLLHTFLFFFIP